MGCRVYSLGNIEGKSVSTRSYENYIVVVDHFHC